MFEAMNLAIFIGSALVVVAVFTSLISFRFGAPLLLIFLTVGLLAGEDGPLGIEFDNGRAAFFVGGIALAIILFDSGFATRAATLRVAAWPAGVLATLGVVITAGLVAVAARAIFGLPWMYGLILGAVVAPTDAAAVFFLLRVGGINVRDRVRSTLEVESGSNDPVAIFLTISLVEFAIAPSEAPVTDLLLTFALQAGVGGLIGIVGGIGIAEIVNRTNFEGALYPIVVLALALGIFAAAGMLEGSGFLAVFVAGLVAGNARIRHAVALKRFQEGTTWLSQIAMFLTLGLLATPSEFLSAMPTALGIAVFLTFLARPIAVWLCMLPFSFTRRERAFISWVGLRGATSILLAIVPAIAGLPYGQAIFNITFIVVLFSLLVQGWTIAPMARWLKLLVPPRLGPVERIELELPGRGNHEIVTYVVHPESPVAKGQRIPRWARPALIVRDGRSLRSDRAGRPQAGDQIYVLTTPNYIRLLDGLFAGPVAGAFDPQLYGEFAIAPETKLADLAAMYEAPVAPGDAELTVAELLRRELAGDIEQGDRIPYGPIDLIVRSVDDEHAIVDVGLALEHSRQPPPQIPLFQSPREIAGLVKAWRARRTSAKAEGAPPSGDKSPDDAA
ncbi:MAG TPA: potassium/proton antiporter [Bauldia sp.]|nr:potassium/proton antiporter [Bauldia sp.]